ncbi:MULTISPECIES: hypothetical protein [Pseudoalteromonas]|uniref:Uncharacterized protein n=1 Tax=Pseudoalteromonas amylolytica TaxID=1859457 RepID=A0A1S1N4P8_9GAMM|nr:MULTISPECIES: hypothetical protein [Pseudoalteromonas]MCF6436389.1 hypothetical protein [Pseudoalteromonas sp. MMG022]OHU91886.1 hypothetical protein BFC16_01980 [Pseudoalteromonas sp. JW3]OHU93220.1 hypothetical protein BET10_01890 [Pseudoalteromonas amylolytica]
MKLINLCSGTLLTLAAASSLSAQAKPNDGIYPPPNEPCTYSTGPEVRSFGLQAFNQSIQQASPIFIGGERYTLSRSDFKPIVKEVTYTCPGLDPLVVTEYSGYTLSLPVYNDFGQKLYFDISGRAAKHMNLSVSCGSFSASDSGDKFYISRAATTGGSCTRLDLRLTFNKTKWQPSYLDLNVMISEALD